MFSLRPCSIDLDGDFRINAIHHFQRKIFFLVLRYQLGHLQILGEMYLYIWWFIEIPYWFNASFLLNILGRQVEKNFTSHGRKVRWPRLNLVNATGDWATKVKCITPWYLIVIVHIKSFQLLLDLISQCCIALNFLENKYKSSSRTRFRGNSLEGTSRMWKNTFLKVHSHLKFITLNNGLYCAMLVHFLHLLLRQLLH